MKITPDDTRLGWPGAVSVLHGDGFVQPWRIPYDQRGLFPPDLLRERAAMPAGVRLAFRSDPAFVAGRVAPYPEMSRIDLCCDGGLVGSVDAAADGSFRFDGLPEGTKAIELWLH